MIDIVGTVLGINVLCFVRESIYVCTIEKRALFVKLSDNFVITFLSISCNYYGRKLAQV